MCCVPPSARRANTLFLTAQPRATAASQGGIGNGPTTLQGCQNPPCFPRRPPSACSEMLLKGALPTFSPGSTRALCGAKCRYTATVPSTRRSCARTHERTQACTHSARKHARTHARTHARMHARTHAHRPHARMPGRAPARTPARTHGDMHTGMIHAHTRARARSGASTSMEMASGSRPPWAPPVEAITI